MGYFSGMESERFEDKIMQVGENITYVDSVGVEHEALITAVWNPNCINVVYVSKDENRTDTFGRQIMRETSVTVEGTFAAHGRFFRLKA